MKSEKFFLAIIFIAFSAVLSYRMIFSLIDERVKIVFCDVGQGDATLIQYKSHQVLIDVGPNSDNITRCLQKHMPIWDRQVELVILTHPDSDHIGGFSVLNKRYQLNSVISLPVDKKTADFEAFQSLVSTEDAQNINPYVPLRKQRIDFCPYCEMQVLITRGEEHLFLDNNQHLSESILQDNNQNNEQILSNGNDLSIAVILHLNQYKILFLGDREVDATQALIDDGLIDRVNLLKVPHHGAKNGLNDVIIAHLRPETYVISSGKNNRYSHPHPDIINLILKNNGNIWRTDAQGDIIFISNGINHDLSAQK